MTVKLREAMSTLPGYVPGKTVPGAIKLASNETPLPPLPHVVERIAQTAGSVNRYPDNWSSELVAALADRYKVPAERVVVGCGSVSLCYQLAAATAQPGDEVLYAWRAFEAYPIVTAISGATPVQVPLRDHVHDLDAMAERISDKTRLIFVCNPNNPTGTAVGHDELGRFLQAVPDDVVVVIDEAYHEFVTDAGVPDATTLLDEHPNALVLRTFSKAYGLAGLRVGYGISGNTEVPAALRQTQSPFAVTAIAQQAALASLEPEAESQLMDRVKDIVIERDRVQAELVAMGYDVPTTQANFVWVPMGDRTMDWASGCADRKVIVRPFAGHGSRVTIGTPDENDQFLTAARELAPSYLG
ncbi:MAG TPA: histidinol-phosphate transaminase [Jatrophihabitantaceae bacterium]